ncbi:hypothetical protein ACVNF4_03220 [Streptomyces sp. S6]
MSGSVPFFALVPPPFTAPVGAGVPDADADADADAVTLLAPLPLTAGSQAVRARSPVAARTVMTVRLRMIPPHVVLDNHIEA